MRCIYRSLSLFCLVCLPITWAKDLVKVVEHTDSGRTVVLNLGMLDGIKRGERAVFLTHSAATSSEEIAAAFLVKAYNNFSIWYLDEIFLQGRIERGEKIKVIYKTGQIQGLARPKYKSKLIVSNIESRGQFEQLQRDQKAGIPQKFVNKKGKYVKAPDQMALEKSKPEEIKLLESYGAWVSAGPRYFDENSENLEAMYIQQLQDEPDRAQLVDEYELERFEAMVNKYKAAGPGVRKNKLVNWEEFYRDQKRDPDQEDFKQDEQVSTYHQLLADIKADKKKRRELLRSLENQYGLDWSDDMSDEELANFLEIHGIYKELGRQSGGVMTGYHHEFHGMLNVEVTSNDSTGVETTSDNSAKFKYDMAFHYQYFLGGRFKNLQYWGVDFGVRRGVTSFNYESDNIGVSELSFTVGAYYYPFHFPSSIEKNIFFVGGFYRFGRSILSRQESTATYDLTSFPNIAIGMKYNTYYHWGFKIQGLYEMNSLTLTNTDDDTGFETSYSFSNLKFSVGLTYVF